MMLIYIMISNYFSAFSDSDKTRVTVNVLLLVLSGIESSSNIYQRKEKSNQKLLDTKVRRAEN